MQFFAHLQQNPALMALLAQQVPSSSPAGPKKARRRSSADLIDDGEEVVAPVASSDEAEFSSSSGNAEEEDSAPAPPMRRTGGREHRRPAAQVDAYSDDEEEEAGGSLMAADRLEHIYLMRMSGGAVEYLVRFQESPLAVCQWIPESILLEVPNAESHIDRFLAAPVDIDAVRGPADALPIAHRRDGPAARPEFLFRIQCESTVLFYWDWADDDVAAKYWRSRRRVAAGDPPLPAPERVMPDVMNDEIVSRDGETMREYQVEGVTWLIKCWRAAHGSVLADEMGLGKTIQALGFLAFLNKHTEWHGPFIIIVRINTFAQWCSEIDRWTDLAYVPYCSAPAQRALLRTHQFPTLDGLGNPMQGEYSFNILLASYDVVLKDIDFLDKINWEVIILDEGHRIKNCKGKKNNVLNNLRTKHRVILTGTPIQNTLQELWTLLRFVSPNDFVDDPEFLETELDELTDDIVMEMKNVIQPHILRRSIAEAERSLAPKEERVIFVGLTQVQKDLIRLTKLHKLWRLKGVQISEDELDASNEGHAIFKVCSHPFLLPEAEAFYTKQLSPPANPLARVDLLLAASVKFQWLDNVLNVLHRDGHRVLIFSQRVELLKLLDEFVGLRGYTKELLLGTMSDVEKSSAIERYSNSESFIFLISTRAGSEGLNLTAADTAIIFDPDWNPQNDLQAQARCHRIGQTQKVDVLRLSTFQTYEHEIFVRAQRKLRLWLTLLGSQSLLEPAKAVAGIDLHPPPPVARLDPGTMTLTELLRKTSTVVTDFSLAMLPFLAVPLEQTVDYSNGLTDDTFILSFPVKRDSGKRRAKRSRSREFQIDRDAGLGILDRFERHGFGQWESIAEDFDDHSDDQVHRFCVVVAILGLRALTPPNLAYLPFLISRILQEEPDFHYHDFLCGNRHALLDIFGEDHDFYLEAEAARRIRAEIFSRAFEFLSVLEMRLVAACWCVFSAPDAFKWAEIAPPYEQSDKAIVTAVTAALPFDPFSLRVQAVVNKMRSDIIVAGLNDDAFQSNWWSGIEFESIVNTLKNWEFDPSRAREFHARTTVLGKSTDEVIVFARTIVELLQSHAKGPVAIPDACHRMHLAPEPMRKARGATSWTQMRPRDCAEMLTRIALIEAIRRKVEEIAPAEPTGVWGDCETRKLLEALLEFGIDAQMDILVDERFQFRTFLSEADLAFARGERKRRVLVESGLPDFLFAIDDLAEFVGGEVPEQVAIREDEPAVRKTRPRRRAETSESSLEDDDDDFRL